MRKIARIGGLVVALLVLVLVSLPFLISANQFRPLVESNLTKALGRKVTVGNLKLSLFSGGVAADELTIAEDPAFGKEDFVKARSLKLGVELMPLIFSRKLNVTGLTIEDPQVALVQALSGDWNYSSLGAKSTESAAPASPPAESAGNLDMSVKLVELKNGRFALKTAGRRKPLALENVNIEVRDFSVASAFPFVFSAKVVGGGDIKLEGKAGPIDPVDTQMTPLSASLDVSNLDLVGSGVAAIAPGLAGVVSFNGKGESSNGLVKLAALLKAERLKVAANGTPARRPVQFDFALDHDLRKHSGALRKGNIKVGAAPASLTGVYSQQGENTFLKMRLLGKNMPIPELAELLPALGIALPSGSSLEGGVASTDLTMEGPTDRLVSKGSVGLNKTRLANFDLGSKVSTVASFVGINAGPNTDIETFTANLSRTPEGLAAESIHFLAPAIGELTGDGTINPTNTLDFKMRAKLHATGRAAILSQATVPFLVQGPATNPIFRADSKALAAEGARQLKETAKEKASKAATGLLDRWLGGKKEPAQ